MVVVVLLVVVSVLVAVLLSADYADRCNNNSGGNSDAGSFLDSTCSVSNDLDGAVVVLAVVVVVQ